MKTEFTVDKEFINEAYNSACSDWKLKIKNKFPDAFEIELEVCKWYKWHGGILHITKIENDCAWFYGVDEYGIWRAKDWYSKSHEHRPELATDKEVEIALGKEWKKIAKVYNYSVKTLEGNTLHNCGFEIIYKSDENKAYLSHGREDCIFDNGKWATILEQPLTLEQRVEQLEKQLLCK